MSWLLEVAYATKLDLAAGGNSLECIGLTVSMIGYSVRDSLGLNM